VEILLSDLKVRKAVMLNVENTAARWKTCVRFRQVLLSGPRACLHKHCNCCRGYISISETWIYYSMNCN